MHIEISDAIKTAIIEAFSPTGLTLSQRTDFLIGKLSDAGFEIASKAAARPDIVRTTTTVEDGHTAIKVHLPKGNPAGIRRQIYLNAVSLLRGPTVPLAEIVAMALGDASPDGCEGNVWKLFDQRLRARGHTIVSDEVDAPFDPSTLAP